eukprot:CAMPEP_0116829694 /NCGR_PEP_ID=MMETSP0418-20121206/4358_1 /TAXON_ID=1158023 /ORGANISM="Astrosyne radiata, Strain 13vi08-1A" /LENGTH=366 /DNA_ID=CAMNT_0004458731 /DNA_START=206 /DNA_END=1306 /DNA_ORIENTATION=-
MEQHHEMEDEFRVMERTYHNDMKDRRHNEIAGEHHCGVASYSVGGRLEQTDEFHFLLEDIHHMLEEYDREMVEYIHDERMSIMLRRGNHREEESYQMVDQDEFDISISRRPHRHDHPYFWSGKVRNTKTVCKLIKLMVHLAQNFLWDTVPFLMHTTAPLHCLLEGSAHPRVLEALLDGYCTDSNSVCFPSVLNLMMTKAPRNRLSERECMCTPLQLLNGPDIPYETLRVAAEYLNFRGSSDSSRFHPDRMIPLHIAIEGCCCQDHSGDCNSCEKSDGRFIRALLKAHPDAARIESKKSKRLPLHLATSKKRASLSCIDHLLNNHPDSLWILDPVTGFPGSLLAAVMHSQLDIVYYLIQQDPSFLSN